MSATHVGSYGWDSSRLSATVTASTKSWFAKIGRCMPRVRAARHKVRDQLRGPRNPLDTMLAAKCSATTASHGARAPVASAPAKAIATPPPPPPPVPAAAGRPHSRKRAVGSPTESHAQRPRADPAARPVAWHHAAPVSVLDAVAQEARRMEAPLDAPVFTLPPESGPAAASAAAPGGTTSARGTSRPAGLLPSPHCRPRRRAAAAPSHPSRPSPSIRARRAASHRGSVLGPASPSAARDAARAQNSLLRAVLMRHLAANVLDATDLEADAHAHAASGGPPAQAPAVCVDGDCRHRRAHGLAPAPAADAACIEARERQAIWEWYVQLVARVRGVMRANESLDAHVMRGTPPRPAAQAMGLARDLRAWWQPSAARAPTAVLSPTRSGGARVGAPVRRRWSMSAETPVLRACATSTSTLVMDYGFGRQDMSQGARMISA
ncbi:hypothetical protein CXG81DRAFT_21357 [Caulochytrium protostelioides]|uniref:Uncharacterized protein n=1 Tax=Caulochytrium protostelioides TaxID=1555241 RepID=A0A4P9X0B8_9FUNG|nr:hypothetical protein CXG81DRAFT_21357 [Caulochytrium protostelioides]|eukprot:RKO98402.1 hypothetical protein CXG81DRAFT_21357 [Caulochytrium protostelioides]